MKSVRACSLWGLSMTALAACSSPVVMLSATASLMALSTPAGAQSGAIVQATPPAMAVERLNQNLTRLSRAPTDMEALIGAGMASYELGDAQAANGFFTRANLVNPRVGRVKVGLALVSVALKQPRDAATYFDEAAALGERADAYLAERALTYDLTGQQEKAQRDYAQALQASPGNSDLIRAYAVSLGISGKVDLAEAQLRPLLYKSDRAAWRDRTMILAMNGRTAEARKIAQTIMPKSLADGMEPYLVRMGSLTPAQKAAATHYGQFPAEGLRLATVTSPPPVQAPARADAASRRTASRDRRKPVEAPVAAPVEDSSLLAAMPRGDAPPAMVQPIPSQPPVQMAAARPAANADAGSDDDPDGYTEAERRRVAARAAAPVAPVPAAPVRVAQGGRVSGSGAVSGLEASATPQGTSVVQSVTKRVASVPVATPQPVQAQAPVQQPASAVPATQPAQAVAAVTPSPAARPVQGPVMGPDPVPAGPPPAPAQATPVSPVAVQPAPTQLMPPEGVATAAAPATDVPQPGFSVAPVAGPASAPPLRTLAAIMADIQVTEDAARAAAAPAVDLDEVARIQAAKRKAVADKAKEQARKDVAAKAKAEADAKLKAEAEEKARLKANPARIWVQIATGKDPAALAFDMRRLRKTYSALADEDAFTAEWGATRRLLVGPYVSATKAKAVLTDLKKAGSDGFVWQSEAGETVTRLSGK